MCISWNRLHNLITTPYIQSDSKPLRQTLRVDRANNKEHFLLNNLCLLTCGFKANTGALLWFHFYSAGWKKLQEVFRVCALYLITLVTSSWHCLSDSGEHARTVSDLIKRSEYRPISSCLVLNGLMYSTQHSSHAPKWKKSRGVSSADLTGHTTGPPLPIRFSL